MDKDEPLFIPEGELMTQYATSIAPSMALLRSNKLTIPPWTEASFWDNIKIEGFGEMYATELLEYLIQEYKAVQKTKSKTFNTQSIEPALISLMHLFITYRRTMPLEKWNPLYEQLISAGNASISHVMLYLHKIMTSTDLNMKTLLDSITSKQDFPIIAATVPIFNFIALLRLLRQSPMAARPLFQAFKTKIDGMDNPSETLILLHTLRLFICLLPGLPKDALESLLEPLHVTITQPVPISTIGADLGKLIIRELEYPGAAFFDILRKAGETKVPDNGAVNIIIGSDSKYIPNMLHTRQLTEFSIEEAIYQFGNFYIHNKFGDRSRSPKHIFKMIQMLDFTEEATEKIIKKLKIKKNDNPEPYSSSLLSAPVVPLLVTRFAMNFELNPMFVQPLDAQTYLFVSPNSTTYENSILKPIASYVTANPGTSLTVRTVVAGGDFLIGNLLLAHVSSLMSVGASLRDVLFTFFIVPTSSGAGNEIAEYIASSDPIYNRFVRFSCPTATTMAPQLDESSTATFPAVIGAANCENNAWFGNPSPSSLLQFSLQHFLAFAEHHVDAFMWKAYLSYEGGRTVAVPFVASLHIGGQFGAPPDPREAKPRMRKAHILTDSTSEPAKSNFTSLVLWNVGVDPSVRANEQILLMETVNDPTRPDVRAHRESLTQQMTRTPIRSLSLMRRQKDKVGPLRIVIDGRTYFPVESLKVGPFAIVENTQLQVRFATFVPFD